MERNKRTNLNGDDDEQVNKAFDEVLTPPFGDGYRIVTVSYTHLTLPTIYSV